MSNTTLPTARRGAAATLVLLLLLLGAPRLAGAADDTISQSDREAIEGLLRKKVSGLLGEKDKDGKPFRRGTYSQSFKKVDATTYSVTFHRDSIEPTEFPKTKQLRTERFALTIKKNSGGSWSIAKEDLKDTYTGLYRGDIADEQYKFDALNFQKEGLTVSATKGSAFALVARGFTVGYRIFAADLKYDYTPPTGTGYYGAIRDKLAKEHLEDLIFKPEYAEFQCDPASCADLVPSLFKGLAVATSGSDSSWQSMKSNLADEIKDRDKRIDDNHFSGFQRPPEADRRYWSFEFRVKNAGKERFVDVDYDSTAPWQMTFYATDYGRQFGIPLFAYYDESTRKSSAPPYILEQREDRDARDFDLEGIDAKIDISLDEPDSLVGDVRYSLVAKRELAELPFRISRSTIPGAEQKENRNPKLYLNSVQDGDGNELTWVKQGAVSGLIVFPKPVPAGTKIALRLQFKNLDSIDRLNPSYASLDRGGWLPLVRFGDFIDHFSMVTRLPAKYEILGVGKKISETIKDDIRTTEWGSDSPVTFPTIIFGEYLSDTAGDYKATKLDGTVIPVRVYVDKVSTQGLSDNAGAAAGARDIRAKQLKAIATQASVALNMYRDVYGADYPFGKLDLVADPEGFLYGQSPASIVYLGFGVFRGEGEVIDFAQRNASQISKFNKDVVAHEVGHQWWGGLITNANQRNYWFVESMAEVSASIYIEKVYGKKQYLDKVADWRRNVIDAEPTASVQAGYTVFGGSLGAAQANIYNKGPYAMYIFRSTFGDDKFFELLKAMTHDLEHKEIVTRDMQDVMERVVGGSMDWFFDQWIRGVGIPQYAMYWTKRRNEQGKWIVEVDIKQRVVFGKDKTELPGVYYRGVAPLTFIDANGKETKTEKKYLVQGPETKFALIVAQEPEQVVFNKDGEILAEDTLVNRSW